MWWEWQERRDSILRSLCLGIFACVRTFGGRTAGAREGPKIFFAWEENKEKSAFSGVKENSEAEDPRVTSQDKSKI